MIKYLALALLALAFAGSSTHAEATHKKVVKATHKKVVELVATKVPKECVPVLRIPVENYVPYPALFSPPDGPRPYSVYYYNLYETFCHGKAEKDCIWTCVPEQGAEVKASF